MLSPTNPTKPMEFSLLTAIIKSIDDAILSYDLNNQINSWNPAAERLYGFTTQQAIGQPISIIVPSDRQEEWEEIHEVVRLDQSIEHFETIRRHQNGHLIDVSITYSPIKDTQNQIIGTAVIARDITEQRKLEQRKDDFIIMASHELKTPITSMKVFAQLLQKQFKDTAADQYLVQLNKMDNQLNRLAKIVSDLLDISKIQSGKLELHKEFFSIHELLQETIENLQGINYQHKITLRHHTNQQIYGDKDRINQVIINLIANAIKYSPDANQVYVDLSCNNHTVDISIQDFGIGISPEHQQKIFDRFFRISGSSDTFPGLGIGLYLSSEIVQRHGGRITVKSQPHQGSRFTVKLPLK